MAKKQKPLVLEVWLDCRPYIRKFARDLVIFLGVWGLLWTGHFVGAKIPIEGETARFLAGAHQTLVVVNYLLLSLFAIYDVLMLRWREGKTEHEAARRYS